MEPRIINFIITHQEPYVNDKQLFLYFDSNRIYL